MLWHLPNQRNTIYSVFWMSMYGVIYTSVGALGAVYRIWDFLLAISDVYLQLYGE
jgi:hypothetical protein